MEASTRRNKQLMYWDEIFFVNYVLFHYREFWITSRELLAEQQTNAKFRFTEVKLKKKVGQKSLKCQPSYLEWPEHEPLDYVQVKRFQKWREGLDDNAREGRPFISRTELLFWHLLGSPSRIYTGWSDSKR